MLVFNYRFILLNELIWSFFMLGIKIRMVLKLELDGLHENVQHFDPRCIESREMHKQAKNNNIAGHPVFMNFRRVSAFYSDPWGVRLI